jgi:hypothetical protein
MHPAQLNILEAVQRVQLFLEARAEAIEPDTPTSCCSPSAASARVDGDSMNAIAGQDQTGIDVLGADHPHGADGGHQRRGEGIAALASKPANERDLPRARKRRRGERQYAEGRDGKRGRGAHPWRLNSIGREARCARRAGRRRNESRAQRRARYR